MTSIFLQPRKSQNVLNFCSYLFENQLRYGLLCLGTKSMCSLYNKNPLYHPLLNRLFAAVQAKQVRMVAIGVGQHEDFAGELEEIAGDNVHTVESFDQLSDLFKTIIEESCSK